MQKILTIALVVLCVVFLAVAPHMIGRYHLEILTVLLIHIILAQSYRLVATTGDWSLGHVALMGCGAYAAAMFSKFLGWPIWLSVPFGAITAGVIAIAFVAPLLRTKGFGFFIGSYALGEFIRLIWIRFDTPFGGSRGIMGLPSDELFGIQLGAQMPFYYLTLIVTLVALWLLWRLDRSRYGSLFGAIHDDEDLCESVGISVYRYRMWAFVIGAFFAGLAGALLAHKQMAVDPTLFDINVMVYLVIWVVVGGISTFAGPILGTTVMTIVFESTRFLEEWRPLLAGALLIFFLVVLPGGIEGIFKRIKMFIQARNGGSG